MQRNEERLITVCIGRIIFEISKNDRNVCEKEIFFFFFVCKALKIVFQLKGINFFVRKTRKFFPFFRLFSNKKKKLFPMKPVVFNDREFALNRFIQISLLKVVINSNFHNLIKFSNSLQHLFLLFNLFKKRYCVLFIEMKYNLSDKRKFVQ